MEAELKAHQEDIAAVGAATEALKTATAKMHASEAALNAAIASTREAIKVKVAGDIAAAFAKP